MTTTEVGKASFTELHALTTRLITQAEALAGLVARLKLDATAEPGDPEVTAQLDRVVDLIGATDLCANLDQRERTTLIGSGRLHHGGAVDIAGFEGHLSEGEPDADLKWWGFFPTVAVDTLLHGHRAGQRIHSRSEDGHQAVPRRLHLVAMGLHHGLTENGEVIPADLVVAEVAQSGEELGRADEISEEDQWLCRCPAPPA
jgi:hypothetical protein